MFGVAEKGPEWAKNGREFECSSISIHCLLYELSSKSTDEMEFEFTVFA